MKEKIIVKNFSVIKDIELEINNINIIIGEQATGKSVLAKLIHFLRTISGDISSGIMNNQNYSQINEKILTVFSNLFPSYFWKENTFNIKYYFSEDKFIYIYNSKNKIHIVFSENIEQKIKTLIKEFETEREEYFSLKSKIEIQKELAVFLYGNIKYSAFFPAGRTFFSSYEQNIYNIQKEGASNDYFMNLFGGIFNNFKHIQLKDNIPNFNKLEKLMGIILKGNVIFNKNDVWFVSEKNKYPLNLASSGQQELTPLLHVLISAYNYYFDENTFQIIEEPEAHIFPSTQKKLVEFFAAIYNYSQKRTGYFLTTHSPYILTCFNNLIQAQNTYEVIINKKDKNEISVDEFNKLNEKLDNTISTEKRINFNNISVFLMKNGKLHDTKDYENKLLDSDSIDKVSEDISEEFNNLLDIEFYGDKE